MNDFLTCNSNNTEQMVQPLHMPTTTTWLQYIPVPAAFLAATGEFRQVNQLFADLLSSDALFLTGKMLFSFWDESQLAWSTLQQALLDGQQMLEQELYQKGHFYLCAFRLINHPEYGANCIAMTCSEVTRYKRRERVLQLNNERLLDHLATDALTGVRNRVALQQMLHDLAALQPNCPLNLLMLDIDDFKQYNLCQSYSCGDELLKQLAQLLQQHIDTEHSHVYRVHSAGFWVSLKAASAWSAYTLAERLRLAVHQQNYAFAQGIDGRITVSIAVHSDVASHSADLNLLEKQLQQRLLDAKEAGKNQSILLQHHSSAYDR